MTDRPRLADARRLADAATEGPWEAFGQVLAHNFGPGDCKGCSGMPAPAHEPACGWEQIGQMAEPDAEFIAASRTLVPAMEQALRDVLALLSGYEQALDEDGDRVCFTEPRLRRLYSEFRRAITAHLDIEGLSR